MNQKVTKLGRYRMLSPTPAQAPPLDTGVTRVMRRHLLVAVIITVVLGWTPMVAIAAEQIAEAPAGSTDYNAQLREGLGIWQSDQPRARDLLSQAFLGAVAARDDLAAGNALVAVSFPALVTETSRSCLSTVGKEQAAYLVDVCGRVSPATHPPCASANSCKILADEIIRGCQMADGVGTAPPYCKPFKLITNVQGGSASSAGGSAQSGLSGKPAVTGSDAGNNSSRQQVPTPATAADTTGSTATSASSGTSVVSAVIAFAILVVLAMVVFFVLRKLSKVSAKAIVALVLAVAIFGAAFAISPPVGLALVILTVVGSILRAIGLAIGRVFATKCPKCQTRMKAGEEEVIDREEKNVRHETGAKAGIYLVEELTVRAWKKCPKCGFETYSDTTRTNRIGRRNDLDLR